VRVRSFDLDGCAEQCPPGTRRRLDDEAMAARDAQIARMRAAHVPFRVIAARLGCSVGSVQKSLRRSGGQL
jgi:hypothetical protein